MAEDEGDETKEVRNLQTFPEHHRTAVRPITQRDYPADALRSGFRPTPSTQKNTTHHIICDMPPFYGTQNQCHIKPPCLTSSPSSEPEWRIMVSVPRRAQTFETHMLSRRTWKRPRHSHYMVSSLAIDGELARIPGTTSISLISNNQTTHRFFCKPCARRPNIVRRTFKSSTVAHDYRKSPR
ncbi:hypothetical protein EDB92DRAFT_1579760 [Lactarius akahatsu]|uniref:Uncharacterized protein n=1 Tax=Lactarius akahatsu TaxID=416441 RepID=A0AAD4LDX7_9AGAM|nr:hypothetical protein EDB92DRAFT_1579760 [Lactarius akahatsu]